MKKNANLERLPSIKRLGWSEASFITDFKISTDDYGMVGGWGLNQTLPVLRNMSNIKKNIVYGLLSPRFSALNGVDRNNSWHYAQGTSI